MQIRPLLVYLESHLFDPDLDANQLKRACGVRDNSLPIYFHHALSLPPYAYIEDCRLEVACRLLSESNLKIWQIAQLLGYSTLQVFSRAFHRWSGLRPSVFRRRSRQTAAAESSGGREPVSPQQAADSGDPLICMTTLRKAVNGGLERPEADDLARRLIELYPDSFREMTLSGADMVPSQPDSEAVVQLRAETAWALLEDNPRQDQRDLLQRRWRASSVELFDLLLEKSREASRRDRRKGVELAELAIDCIAASADTLAAEQRRALEAKGWACVATQRLIAVDLPGAEQAFARADACLEGINADPLIVADVLARKCWFRQFQRRMREALALGRRAVAAGRAAGEPGTLAECLLARAQVHLVANRFAEGLPDVREAARLAVQVDDLYLRLTTYQHLAHFLTMTGSPREAARYLPSIGTLCRELRVERNLPKISWTEGLVAKGLGRLDLAERHLRAAHEGFSKEQQPYEEAVAGLDLAQLYAEQGRTSDLLQLARDLVPALAALKLYREALTAHHLLREAIAAEELTLATLRRIRSCLGRMESGPGD